MPLLGASAIATNVGFGHAASLCRGVARGIRDVARRDRGFARIEIRGAHACWTSSIAARAPYLCMASVMRASAGKSCHPITGLRYMGRCRSRDGFPPPPCLRPPNRLRPSRPASRREPSAWRTPSRCSGDLGKTVLGHHRTDSHRLKEEVEARVASHSEARCECSIMRAALH